MEKKVAQRESGGKNHGGATVKEEEEGLQGNGEGNITFLI